MLRLLVKRRFDVRCFNTKLIGIFLLLALYSCKPFKEAEFTGVKDFKINSVDLKGIEASISLGIRNPNNIGFSVYPSKFDVSLFGIHIGQARLKKRVHIKANTEKAYSFKLKSDFKDMNPADVLKLMSGGNFGTIHVKGNLKAGKFYLKKKIPVDVKEKLR